MIAVWCAVKSLLSYPGAAAEIAIFVIMAVASVVLVLWSVRIVPGGGNGNQAV